MGEEDRNKADWKKSWKDWFQKPEGERVKSILEKGRQQHVDESAISGSAAPELRRLTKSDRTTTEAVLHKRLESLTLEQLRAYVSSQVSALNKEENSWEGNRKVGWRKVTTGISEFVQDFDTFLSRFSGVVEIVKLADSQYGGVASLVLSVFFATVKLKAANDSSIQSCMRTVANRLPDLEIYYQVFADEHLATMLTEAYTDIIVFAQTATIYFQGHGFVRLMKGIVQPQKFQGLEEGVGHNFEEIRIRCNALVARRIFNLSTQNEELLRQVKSLNNKIEEMQERKDGEMIRAILGRQNSEPKHLREKNLSEFRQFLASVFSPYSDDISLMTLDALRQVREFQTWQKADSSMLILHGCNHPDCSIVPQSWLSLTALDLVQDLHSSSSNVVVAHCNCDREMKPEEAIKSVIEQLLEQQSQVLRRMSDADDIAYGLGMTEGHGSTSLDGCCHTVAQILQRCNAPVYIVINRPEVCQGDGTWRFVRSLLKLVEDATVKVKILLVLRTELWNIQDWLSSVDTKTLESHKLLVFRRDQTECY